MLQKMIGPHGQIKFAPIGFSWTTLLFGFFVPLLRGDLIMFLIMFLLTAFLPIITNIVFAFCYNGIYYKSLLNNGYVPADGSYVRVSHTTVTPQPVPTIVINNTTMASTDKIDNSNINTTNKKHTRNEYNQYDNSSNDNSSNDNSSNDSSSNDTNYPGPM